MLSSWPLTPSAAAASVTLNLHLIASGLACATIAVQFQILPILSTCAMRRSRKCQISHDFGSGGSFPSPGFGCRPSPIRGCSVASACLGPSCLDLSLGDCTAPMGREALSLSCLCSGAWLSLSSGWSQGLILTGIVLLREFWTLRGRLFHVQSLRPSLSV